METGVTVVTLPNSNLAGSSFYPRGNGGSSLEANVIPIVPRDPPIFPIFSRESSRALLNYFHFEPIQIIVANLLSFLRDTRRVNFPFHAFPLPSTPSANIILYSIVPPPISCYHLKHPTFREQEVFPFSPIVRKYSTCQEKNSFPPHRATDAIFRPIKISFDSWRKRGWKMGRGGGRGRGDKSNEGNIWQEAAGIFCLG